MRDSPPLPPPNIVLCGDIAQLERNFLIVEAMAAQVVIFKAVGGFLSYIARYRVLICICYII